MVCVRARVGRGLAAVGRGEEQIQSRSTAETIAVVNVEVRRASEPPPHAEGRPPTSLAQKKENGEKKKRKSNKRGAIDGSCIDRLWALALRSWVLILISTSNIYYMLLIWRSRRCLFNRRYAHIRTTRYRFEDRSALKAELH